MNWLGPLDGDRCLEIGCGGGVLLERVLAAGASSAAGLDHSPDMLASSMARNAEALATDRLALKLGDASAIPWADQSFDAVFTANMFFYIEDPAAVLDEVFRVLRPGGRLVIHTAPGPLPPPSLKTLWVLLPMVSVMHVHTGPEMADLYKTLVSLTSRDIWRCRIVLTPSDRRSLGSAAHERRNDPGPIPGAGRGSSESSW